MPVQLTFKWLPCIDAATACTHMSRECNKRALAVNACCPGTSMLTTRWSQGGLHDCLAC